MLDIWHFIISEDSRAAKHRWQEVRNWSRSLRASWMGKARAERAGTAKKKRRDALLPHSAE
jgi:hypothetical protein